MGNMAIYYKDLKSKLKKGLEFIYPNWTSESLDKYKTGSNVVVVYNNVTKSDVKDIRRYIRDDSKVYIEGHNLIEDITSVIDLFSNAELSNITFVLERFYQHEIGTYNTGSKVFKYTYFPYSLVQAKIDLKDYDYKKDRPFQKFDYVGSTKFNSSIRDRLYHRGIYKKLKVINEPDIDIYSKAKVVLLPDVDKISLETWYAIAAGTPFVNVNSYPHFSRDLGTHLMGGTPHFLQFKTDINPSELGEIEKVSYMKNLYENSDHPHVLSTSLTDRDLFFTSSLEDSVGRLFTRFLFANKYLL